MTQPSGEDGSNLNSRAINFEKDEPSTNRAVRQIARGAGIVMVSFVFSNLLGLLAKSLIAQAFGTSMETDALYAANRFSETLFNLVAGGALGSAFIPTFTGLLATGRRSTAWKLASAMANMVLLVLAALSLLAALFAPAIVRHLLAPGFTEPAQQVLTASLLRIQLPSAAIFALSGLLMGVLNAHQSFLIPALAPSLYSIGIIIGVALFSPFMGIAGVGWGVVLGSLLHLALQIPWVLRLPERRYTFTLGINLPEVVEVLRLMGPRLLGVAVVQLNFWVNTLIASGLPPGSLTGITLAFPLMLMPQAAIAQSIAIAALPTFSAQVARGKLDEMRSTLSASLRGILFLALPASVGLILLREPIVALVYQRGEFSALSTSLVSWALLWYAVGLVGHCLVEIGSRAFYALHDTRTPVLVGVAAMSLNIVFSLMFARLFGGWGVPPLGGLALANSLATALEAVALLYLMSLRLNGLDLLEIARSLLRMGIASLVMALGLWGTHLSVRSLPNWIVALGGVIAGGLVYLICSILVRSPELSRVWKMIWKS
jgi:putative peptidoglycan lipid II flippase